MFYSNLINGSLNAVGYRGMPMWESAIGFFGIGCIVIFMGLIYLRSSNRIFAEDYNFRETDSIEDNCTECKYYNSKPFKGSKNCKKFKLPTNENYVCDLFNHQTH